ncbi:hypothetical protein P154DRAFT_606336 [Amniculicola lignicola CBS 123094]|uniref:Uncharacterized protein n=1 Tax=Amniculicola lignicola CBS 123094 TaxID=1392246 RepID=A0A6A5WWL8_9PLEO|nr:hypothetical protein P154DRAFT_606336 [Amniculicola lignicola CBS 123094]
MASPSDLSKENEGLTEGCETLSWNDYPRARAQMSLTQEEVDAWPDRLYGSWEDGYVPPQDGQPILPEQPYDPHRECMNAIESFDWNERPSNNTTCANEPTWEELLESNQEAMMSSPTGSDSEEPRKRVRFNYDFEESVVLNPPNENADKDCPTAPKAAPQTQQKDGTSKGGRSVPFPSHAEPEDVVMTDTLDNDNQNIPPSATEMPLRHSTQPNMQWENGFSTFKSHIQSIIDRDPNTPKNNQIQEAIERYVRATPLRMEDTSTANQTPMPLASVALPLLKHSVAVDIGPSLLSLSPPKPVPTPEPESGMVSSEEEASKGMQLDHFNPTSPASPSATPDPGAVTADDGHENISSGGVEEDAGKEVQMEDGDAKASGPNGLGIEETSAESGNVVDIKTVNMAGSDDVVMGVGDMTDDMPSALLEAKNANSIISADDSDSSLSELEDEETLMYNGDAIDEVPSVLLEEKNTDNIIAAEDFDSSLTELEDEEIFKSNGEDSKVTLSKNEGGKGGDTASEDDMDWHSAHSEATHKSDATPSKPPKPIRKSSPRMIINNSHSSLTSRISNTARDSSPVFSISSLHSNPQPSTNPKTPRSRAATPGYSPRATRSKKPTIMPGIDEIKDAEEHNAWSARVAIMKAGKRDKLSKHAEFAKQKANTGMEEEKDKASEKGETMQSEAEKQRHEDENMRRKDEEEKKAGRATRRADLKAKQEAKERAAEEEAKERAGRELEARIAKEMTEKQRVQIKAKETEERTAKEPEKKMKLRERRGRRESSNKGKEMREKLEERGKRKGRRK